MMLREILSEKAIQMNLVASKKEEAIEALAVLLCQAYNLTIQREVVEEISKREKLGSTGMGHGIAIPHCKLKGIDKIYLGIGISRQGIDFKALDGEPVHIFFVLIAPADSTGPHLKVLARISRLLRDEYFCRSLIQSPSVKNIYQMVLSDDESRKD